MISTQSHCGFYPFMRGFAKGRRFQKRGDVIWYLQRGNAEKIEWIRLKWSAHVGGEDELDGEMKEYEVELKLK